jgi:hypothetical protein
MSTVRDTSVREKVAHHSKRIQTKSVHMTQTTVTSYFAHRKPRHSPKKQKKKTPYNSACSARKRITVPDCTAPLRVCVPPPPPRVHPPRPPTPVVLTVRSPTTGLTARLEMNPSTLPPGFHDVNQHVLQSFLYQLGQSTGRDVSHIPTLAEAMACFDQVEKEEEEEEMKEASLYPFLRPEARDAMVVPPRQETRVFDESAGVYGRVVLDHKDDPFSVVCSCSITQGTMPRGWRCPRCHDLSRIYNPVRPASLTLGAAAVVDPIYRSAPQNVMDCCIAKPQLCKTHVHQLTR